jgi:alpha-galactosidase
MEVSMKKDLDLQQLTFSLRYDDTAFADLLPTIRISLEEDTEGTIRVRRTRYALPDGLEITRTVRQYPEYGAVEQVLSFSNKADRKSGLITHLMDADLNLVLDKDPAVRPGWRVDPCHTRIISTSGSDCTKEEFYPAERIIRSGESICYAPSGGRSSSKLAPFFDINQDQHGWLCAIGWTGQWQACMGRTDECIRLQTGIEDVSFRLLPGEQLRTSSWVLLPYSDGKVKAHNTFRRLVKQHFSLIGRPGRPEQGPFCTMNWGSMPSESMIRRIERMDKERFGYEYLWIDAAWYGASDGYCPSEFEGDWYTQTGNWQINPRTHPDGLRDVSAALKKRGMKLLLWIEPERVISTNPLPQQRPEWFLKRPDDTSTAQNWLLDLGNPAALAYTIDMVSNLIQDLDLGCYRQDFNCDPLPYWQANDEADRRGITQIKHIMGLYTFWDTLLERFPGLIIDNCSSGGRRIDIETLRRSIPLWRSDYQCVWDYMPEVSQMHSMGFASWLPYSGTGVGRVMGDTYRFRSSYAGALVMSYWGYEDREIDDSQPLEWVRRTNAEYKRVRPYFYGDYYPLTPLPGVDGGWVAWQYDRPAQSDGIVQVFRQPQSPCETARLEVGGLMTNGVYTFENADTGETVQLTSEVLAQEGLMVCLPQRRSSQLLFYSFCKSS